MRAAALPLTPMGTYVLDCPVACSRPLRTSDRALCMAEDAARELRSLPLADALQLVHLYLERGSPKAEQAARRWLVRCERGVAEPAGRRPGHGESGRVRVASARGLVELDLSNPTSRGPTTRATPGSATGGRRRTRGRCRSLQAPRYWRRHHPGLADRSRPCRRCSPRRPRSLGGPPWAAWSRS